MTQRQSNTRFRSAHSSVSPATTYVGFATADLHDYLNCSSSTSSEILANATTRIAVRRPVPTHVARIGTHGEEQ